MRTPFVLKFVLPLMSLSFTVNQLMAQQYPAVDQQQVDEVEAFFPKRKSLNSAIERSREDQRRLQENAYPS